MWFQFFKHKKLIHKYLPTYYRKKASARSLSKQRICTPTGIVRQIFTGTGKMILFGLCSRFDYILWIHLGEYKSSLFWGKIEKNLFNFDNSFSYYTIISCHRYEIRSCHHECKNKWKTVYILFTSMEELINH